MKKKYVVIRTYSAGVHAGYLEEEEGMKVTLSSSRRIWYWSGACSLSQLATEGVKNPSECKFAMPVDEIKLEAIEIITCTEKARKNIEEVWVWKK